MDQMPNDGLVNTNVFGDGQHLAFDDTLFPAASDQAFNDASWGLHASNYPQPGSRAVSTHNVPSWPQPASHMPASNTPTNFHGQSNVYGRSPLHSPASFTQNNSYSAYGNANFNNFNQQQAYPQHISQQNINPAFQQQSQQQSQLQHQQQSHSQPQQQHVQQYNVAPSNIATTNVQHVVPVDQRQATVSQEKPQPVANSSAPSQKQPTNPATHLQGAADQSALVQSIPSSDQNGRFSMIDFSTLVKATNSERLTMFANMGKQTSEFPVNRSTALPAYTKRSSRNELKRQAKDNPKLLARLGAKISQSDRTSAAASRSTSAASPAQSTHSNDGIKHESDSDSDSDSDVSLYSDEEDELAGAPLPSKRPEESAKGAVEYDTIKALWRNKRKTIDASSIRKGLGDFWEVAKTIRDRWKADTQAVLDAEAKKRVGDLALLKGRVKDQRDMLEVAFRAALKHGFRGIIELFSENQSFLYLCYQFLLDRFKAEDVNGSVSRLILEILSLTTSITEEKLDKTFLGKILPRYVKGGDAKTKYYAKKVLEGAASNSKGKQTKPTTDSSVGVKRSSTAAGNAPSAAPAKKAATVTPPTNGTNSSSKTLASVKKPVESAKPTTSTTPAAATKTKTVQAKSSGFFNGLQSVGKKPGTSNTDKNTTKPTVQKAPAAPVKPAFNLAAELANLAKPKEEPKKPEPKADTSRDNESPERKVKRAARLARGATGVRWKEAQDLVEVRYFSHDPAEELDHDASQMRDVKDVGGEGRMLKQHADMMDVDEDDDSAEEENNKFVAYRTPSEVDFSTVDTDERDRQFAPYGGGKLQPESKERAIREQYERDNLIVIYSSPSDIPPNPREPSDPSNGEQGEPLKEFGVPPEKFLARAHQRNAKKMAHMPASSIPGQAAPQPAPGFDIAAFSQYMAAQQVPLPTQQPAATPAPVPQQQQPAASFDLTAILKQFQPQSAAAPAQPQPQQPLFNFQQPNFQQPQQQGAVSRPNGEPDISAILAALNNSNNAQAPPAPAPPAFQFPPNFPMPFAAPSEQYQQQTAQQQQAGGNANGKEKQNPWYKTKACKYWQEGKCKKGDACSYLHE